MPLAPFLTALAAAALFGAATPACKPLLDALSPFQLAGMLYLGAMLGVLPAAFAARAPLSPFKLDRRNQGLLVGAIAFGGIIGPVLLLFGLKLASAASVSLWLNLELAATAVLGALFFRDALGRAGWIAAAGALLAASWLAWGEGGTGFLAALLVFLACVCWGLDNHFTALVDGVTPAGTTFWKGLVAGTVNLVIGLIAAPWAASSAEALAALTVGALAYGASIALYISAAQRLGATRSQIVFSSAPFFGVLFATIFLAEPLSPVQLGAGAILALSIVLLAWEQHQHDHRHDAQEHEHAHRHDDTHHDHEHPEGDGQGSHSHKHRHAEATHAHPHWPDLHHRHDHE